MTLDTTTSESFQLTIEDAAVEAGAERYKASQERKADREGYERRDDVAKLIRGAIPILSTAIKGWVANAEAGKGRKPLGLKALQLLDPDQLAYIGLSRVFNLLGKGGSITDIVVGIGRSIEIELEAAAIIEKDPKAAKRFMALAEGEARESVMARRHEKLATKLEVSLNWDRRRQTLTGDIVLGVILTSLEDIFQRGMATSKQGTMPVVCLTDEAAACLNEMQDMAAWLKPLHQPMLDKPAPWTALDTGCYADPRIAKTVPLVRTFSAEHKRLVREALSTGSMQQVLTATNAIQETRFAIDTRVLALVHWVRNGGLQPSPSFPVTELPPLPLKTPKADWDLLTPEARTAKARERKTTRDIRNAAGIDAGVFISDTDMACDLAEAGAFYLPHSLDFRGRTYAVPYFNHQRSDHLKGMFCFADKVRLGLDGGEWLMVHLANCGDFGKISKQPFDARMDWVDENEALILSVAADPRANYDLWSEADKPFCFLQACFEFAEWVASGRSEDFMSVVPISADGSCSGLQHYAAMTRSTEEAYHVNLTGRDTVGDIYQVTADAAVPSLQFAAGNGDIFASTILANGFGRSEVKRNVMTYFYGSGKFGMRDQHMEDTMRPASDQVALGKLAKHPYEFVSEKTGNLDGGFMCAQTMAAHVYQAVVTVAPKADEAASYIQAIAGILAHESLSMIWTTPTGLPVVQRYCEFTSKQINLWLYDRKVSVPTGDDKLDHEGNILSRVRLLVREAPTSRVAKKRMRSAASPNLVHSMDGAHLQLAVVKAKEAGIDAFMMIHDSFGTHAGNMTTFNRVIREAFVEMYTDYCPLTALDTYARSVLSEAGIEKLPAIPAKGALDLSLVLQSPYAFA
jgi:DNA-directed RNA polymerase